MKLAILEWICGGGLAVMSAPLDNALLREGWLMLSTLVEGLTTAGHEVVVPLDRRILEHSELAKAVSRWQAGQHRVELLWIFPPAEAADNSPTQNLVDRHWLACCEDCGQSIVIAPEFKNILADTIRLLSVHGVPLINCRDPLLGSASDKLLTAIRLRTAACAHPPTEVVDQLSQDWLRCTSQEWGNTRWVIKPADGAGCDRLLITDNPDAAMARRLDCTGLIIQPWIEGLPFSCSAVVDRNGVWYWQPLVTQEFAISVAEGYDNSADGQRQLEWTQAIQRSHTLKYVGARLAGDRTLSNSLKDVLDRMATNLGAGGRGWVGVDLLFLPESDEWVIIEINPRCTTSMCYLATHYQGNLVADWIALALGLDSGLPEGWNRTGQG